jgi:hypothetical protein
MDHSTFVRPAFVVGVTGDLDPHKSAFGNLDHDVPEKVRLLFRFLKGGAESEKGLLLWRVQKSLPHPRHNEGLNLWPGLPNTPIVVLTSLAPGAASLVAQVALEKAQREMGILVQAPLPLPKKLYRESSTFVKDPAMPTESEKAHQECLERLIDQIGEENAYPVRLADEIDMDEDTLCKKIEADPTRRRYRYQAAGEYIAAHCDLLLALWDDDYHSGGCESTGSIVQAKLRGIIPTLLTAADSFAWADCGSVVHIYMPHRQNPNGPNQSKIGQISWLHPEPAPTDRETAAARESEQTGNHLLCRLARNLDEFNHGYQVPKDRCQPLYKVLDPDSPVSPTQPPCAATIAQALQTEAPEVFNALVPLAAARRFSADISRSKLRPRSQFALLIIFFLVFVSAVCLDIYSNLPQNESGVHATAKKALKNSFAALVTRYAKEIRDEFKHWPPDQFEFGAGCLLSGFLSLVAFWWHRPHETEERDHDYRALAEGLRVQFAWCLAGLNRSAAAHYMERQRNELEWIRSALSSLSMPHHRWSTWFSGMNGGLRLRLLRWTWNYWVFDQFTYHNRRATDHKRKLDLSHKVGGVLALGGFLQLAALVFNALQPFLQERKIQHLSRNVLQFGAGAGLLFLALFLFFWLRASFRTSIKKRAWTSALATTFLPVCWSFIRWLVFNLHPSSYQSHRMIRWRMLLSFLGYLPMAAVAGFFALAGSIAYANRGVGGLLNAHLPDAHVLVLISSGIFLLAGALLVAWTEKTLLSEQAYQFNVMASLFKAAWVRLDDCLRAAEEAPDPDTRDARIKQAQYILYDLGTEALDENAEWLILHRARPLEPMMAG